MKKFMLISAAALLGVDERDGAVHRRHHHRRRARRSRADRAGVSHQDPVLRHRAEDPPGRDARKDRDRLAGPARRRARGRSERLGPSLTKYRYVYSGSRVMLVDPETRMVVQEVD